MNMREIINLLEDSTVSPFQRWFAGSKIVDADGKPMKLYHGTSKDQDFKSFKMPKNGVWFTNDPAEASNYAKENDSMDTKYDGRDFIKVHTAARVIPCYVRAINPIFLHDWPEKLLTSENYKRAQAEYFEGLRRQGHDAVIYRDGMIVVALESPNQIKSAIGNVTFDPNKKGLAEAYFTTQHVKR